MESVTCSGSVPLPILVLGQIPLTLHDQYTFKFMEISGQNIVQKNINMTIGQQYWFWHMFKFKKNFEGKAGKLLNMEYQ